MKLKEILENLLDGPEEHKPPERKPDMGVLDANIQKYIDRAIEASPEAQRKLDWVKAKIEGPNVILTTKKAAIVFGARKAEKPTTATTIPLLYLKKYLNNPKMLADILLKKGM